MDKDTIGIIGTHPEPPFNKKSAKIRNTHLSQMVKEFSAYTKPLVILGDLNCTPYSHHFKEVLKGLRLKDSRCNFGLMSSWPTGFFPMLIPIDHCLYNDKCSLIERRVGPDIGSDHFPIYATIGF